MCKGHMDGEYLIYHPKFLRGHKKKMAELLPLKLYPFTLNLYIPPIVNILCVTSKGSDQTAQMAGW